jgi:hypothetical protein
MAAACTRTAGGLVGARPAPVAGQSALAAAAAESLRRLFPSAGLFASYAERDTIERVLAGIGRRLKHDNPLATAGPALWQRDAELRAAFARFFPQLVDYATGKREELLQRELTTAATLRRHELPCP